MDQIDENPPQRADQTTVKLSQRHEDRNQETARQKEYEYHKKATDEYEKALKRQLEGHNVNHVQFDANVMQKNLDDTYMKLYKEYVRKKKDYVRDFKIRYVKQMHTWKQSYLQIGALELCKCLPNLADKIQQAQNQIGYGAHPDEVQKIN